jgi:lysophospholipase L1-like esterase
MGTRDGRIWRRLWPLYACLLLLGVGIAAALGFASPATAQHHRRQGRPRAAFEPRDARWISTWAASPQVFSPGSLGADGFSDQTIRNVVFTSVGGTIVRVRFTNVFGSTALDIGRAAIGLAGNGAGVVSGTEVPLSFDGRPWVVIRPGAEALSDPVSLSVPGQRDLAVSVFLPRASGPATGHVQAQQVNYVAPGDHALDEGASAFTTPTRSWYFVDSVDVVNQTAGAGTIVALGDSITDGVGSQIDANARWPNDLARRLDPGGLGDTGVVDEGIGGNRVLSDPPCCGVSAVSRFERDVATRAGAREVILLEGINDIGQVRTSGPLRAPHTDVSAAQIIAGDEQIIQEAHAAGLEIIGATMTPFGGSVHWTAAGTITREQVNNWILTSGAFDGVIDFAKIIADPADPQIINPAYDSGDHLHPNDAGYQAMADAISVAMLRRHERRLR